VPYNESKVLRYGMCYQDQFYLPPTCAPTNGMSHPAFTPQLRSITILWPVLISHPAVGRRLSWRLSDHLTNTMHIVVAVAFPRLESFPESQNSGSIEVSKNFGFIFNALLFDVIHNNKIILLCLI